MTNIDYKQVASSSKDADQESKVLAVVRAFPFRTSQELANKVNDSVLKAEAFHRRLPDLRKRGLVFNGDRRECTISGRKAQTWHAIPRTDAVAEQVA